MNQVNAMRVTLKEISERTGVSKSLISMYLNKDPRVRLGEEKKRRIDEAVRMLNYRPSVAACTLRKGRSGMLGLVLGAITDAYFSHLAEASLMYGELRGYQLLFALTKWNPEKEKRGLENLLERQVDGILYAPRWQDDARLAGKLAELGIPVLLLNQSANGLLSARRNPAGAYAEMAETFRKDGHRSVTAYRTDEDPFLEQACRRAGLEFRNLPCREDREEEFFAELLRARPSALFLRNCRVAGRLLEAIRKYAGAWRPDIVTVYHFPEDFIDDPRVTGYLYGNFYGVVKTAMTLLIDRVESRGNPSSPEHAEAEAGFFRRDELLKRRDSLIDTIAKAERQEAPAANPEIQ